MHPRIPLASLATRAHCWLMVNLWFPSTPRSLFTELLSSRSAPSLYWCMGLFLPRCRTLHLLLLNFIRFVSAQLSGLSRSRWMAAQPSGVSANSSQFCVISKLVEGTLCPFIQVIDEEVEQDWAKYWALENPASWRPPTTFYATDDNPLSSAIQPVLNLPPHPLI